MTGQDLDSTLLCSKTWEQSVVEFTQRTKYTVIYSFSQESYCYAVCKQKVKVKSLSRVRLFANPWTVAYQAPPSMGFSRQKYWSGLPCLPPGHLPKPGIKPRSPALQVCFTISATREAQSTVFLLMLDKNKVDRQ